MKLIFFKDAKGQFRARMVFSNGRIFATTEGYSSLRRCKNSVATYFDVALEGNVLVVVPGEENMILDEFIGPNLVR